MAKTKGILQIGCKWFRLVETKSESCKKCFFYKQMGEKRSYNCSYNGICNKADTLTIFQPLEDFSLVLENKNKIAECVRYEFTDSPRKDIQAKQQKIINVLKSL